MERILDHTREGASGLGAIRVYKPVQRAPDRWECMLDIQEARDPGTIRRETYLGVDSVQALFNALRVAEIMADRRYNPTTPDTFVERTLDYTDGDSHRPVTVRIYKPVQRGPEEWGCISVIAGLKEEDQALDHAGEPYMIESRGADGVQALFHALRIEGVRIDRHKGKLSWNKKFKPWEPVVLNDATEMKL
ncbi:MAG: DUF6968 family protein [Byssovorax sp.]